MKIILFAFLIIFFLCEKKKFNINIYTKIAVSVVLIRVAVVAAVCMYSGKGYLDIFNIWDGPHYVDIAKNGYVNSGNGAEFIVFYPLYPLLIRVFSYISGSMAVAGILISNAAAVVGSIYFYKLCRLDAEEKDSIFAVLLLNIFPFSFFMSGVYTESLFIMLTAMSMYYLRKNRVLLTSGIAFLAALTRVQGVLLAVLILLEALKSDRRKSLYSLIPVLGFCVYLLINKITFGNAFEFMKYQKEIWYQSPSWMGDNLANFVNYLRNGSELSYQIMLPQLALFLASCILIAVAVKKGLSSACGIYSAAYIFTVYSASWLLSGGRYMLSLLPLHMATAIVVKNENFRKCIIILNVLLLLVYACLYSDFKQIM